MITTEHIDPSVLEAFDMDPSCGGVVSFLGVVRADDHGGRVTGIYYECYDVMAEREIEAIIEEGRREFGVKSIDVLHRVGEVKVGEVSLSVRVVAAHRRHAFAACQYVIDAMKARVPIWKKERYEDGTDRWL